MNLVTGGLGAGILSLPWSTAGASVVPAVAVIAATLLVNAWTISVLVRAAERHQTFDLGGLLALLPNGIGPYAQAFTNLGIWFSMYLCLIGYMVIVADCSL